MDDEEKMDLPQSEEGESPQETWEDAPAGEVEQSQPPQEGEEALYRRHDQVIAGLGMKDPQTGTPVENFQDLKRYDQRYREERQRAQTAQERRDFMVRDLAEFVERYPGTDVARVENDPQFRKFAGKRLYREPLTQLYGDFIELMGEAQRTAEAKADQKRRRGTGGGGSAPGAALTSGQAMALAEWNRANPEMKMTPKEFLRK